MAGVDHHHGQDYRVGYHSFSFMRVGSRYGEKKSAMLLKDRLKLVMLNNCLIVHDINNLVKDISPLATSHFSTTVPHLRDSHNQTLMF